MRIPGRANGGSLQRWLARLGLLLMAVCFVWLELLPRRVPSPVVQKPSVQLNRDLARVVIDPGHGGKDSGAIHNGVAEKDLTLDVALRLDRLMQARGIATTMTRRGDEWLSLSGRAAVANREHDCVFVSIHFDEGARAAATGVQTFYAARQVQDSIIPSWLPFLQRAASEGANPKSQSLAGFVQAALVTRTQAHDRGTRAEQFYVVANVRHPAVLIEGGFLSNSDDISKLATEAYREQLAESIADGIAQYREVTADTRTTLVLGSAAPE